MKETVKKVLSFALAFLMTFGACDTAVAYAAEEVVKAVNPTSGILLNVPEKYKNAGDLFFIEKADWALYEKSGEPVYIPIQRTGDLNKDAEITLKVIDLTAKHDVNYTAEIYKDKTDPTISYADVSVKELTLSDSAEIKEVETTDENGMAKVIYEAGGADITDAAGTVIGSVKALPLDENGNLIETGEKTGEEQPAAETTAPAAETTAPAAETTAPAAETAAPTAETAAPTAETTEPATETTEPAVEATAAAEAETETEGEPEVEITPEADKTEPAAETTEPTAETTEPTTETTAPTVETTEPEVKTTEPATEATAPATETTAPATETTGSETVKTAPEGEEKAPATEKAEPKTETTEPKTEKTGTATETTGTKAGKTALEADSYEIKTVAASDKDASPTQKLRAARSNFTGKASDRQELKGNDVSDLAKMISGNTMTDEEFDREMADATQDGYPGREYRLHFAPGEEAKYLKVTPLYSSLAEGDAQVMLMLKEPSEGCAVGEDVNPVNIVIFDEDEPEQVYIGMAAETVIAEDGKATVTVTREGRLNVIKGVKIASWGGSAKEGDEYSGVGANLYFPMGIKSRTLEIPVHHGEEQKDFYLTITALNDENVRTATTHVIIPEASKTGGDGELMGVDNISGHPLTEPINLKAGEFRQGGFDSDTEFHVSTRANVEYDYGEYVMYPSANGCAYDGVYAHFNWYLNYCDAEARLFKYANGSWTYMHKNYEDDGGKHDDHWLYGAWGKYAPDTITIGAQNVDNEGPVGTDSYVAMWVDEVRLIKRRFNINVEPAEVKPLIGMTNEQVLNDYEAVMLDNSTYSQRSLWTEDSFALTAKNTKSPLRLVGIEAKVRDNTKEAWYRIATIDGKSDTAVVRMNASVIKALDAHSCIYWEENGSPDIRSEDSTGYTGKFYKGTITVRPVFDYIDTTVELKNGDQNYGALRLQAPTPSMLWDFNSDRKMDDVMGVDSFYATKSVSWTGAKEGNNDYYTFTASGGDPFVPVITHAENVENIRYIKVRAKNLNGADKIQLYASIGGSALSENAHIDIPLEKDAAWHEYVVDIKNSPGYKDGGWNGRISYIRLDPMDGNVANGSQIQIDYMAFFSSEDSARAFRAEADGGVSGPATLTYHLGDKVRFTTEMNGAGTAANMAPDGFYYELRKSSQNGDLINFNDVHYINGSIEFQMSDKALSSDTVDHPYYLLKPTFIEKGNRITVVVPDMYYNKYLDTTKGLFADGDEYYTFTASSEDPRVSVDTSANASDIRWAKLRVRNISGADGLQIFTGSGASSVSASDGAWVPLGAESYWREYVVDLFELNKQTAHSESTTWTGNIEWFRLDPMDGNVANGSQIQIDYIAFFPNENSARAFKNDGTSTPAMLWDFNKAGGPAMGGHCKADVSYAGAKDDAGNYVSVTHNDGAYYYVIAEDVLTNDIYELDAYTKNADGVIPKWTLSDGSEYFGNALYIRSNPRAKDNAITLTAASGGHLTYMTLSGTIYSSTMNLASGRSATDINPASGAIVSLGTTGAVTDEDGKFTTSAILYDSEARVRFLVSYNGVTTIQEAKVPSNNAPKSAATSVTGKQVSAVTANADLVRVDTYSETGAHFVSAVASQRGQLTGALHALTLNGKELRVLVQVAKGGEYTIGNKTYTENIKDVTLFFMDQETGEIPGRYSSNTEPAEGGPAKWSYDDETGEFWLVINTFDPAHPTEWTYGDVLMARLTSDKRTAMNGMGEDDAAVRDMVYDAVSTGYGVYADPNYQPMVLDVKAEDVAAMLGVEPKTDEDGDLLDDDTRYSFGAFPYIGQITAAVGVVSKVVATVTKTEDSQKLLNDLKNAPDPASLMNKGLVVRDGNDQVIPVDEDEFDKAAEGTFDDAGQKSTTYTFLFSIFFEVMETPYGGVRFMLGVIVGIGGGKAYTRQKNPFHNKQSFAGKMKERPELSSDRYYARGGKMDEFSESTAASGIRDADTIQGMNQRDQKQRWNLSDYGGFYFKFTAYIGVYLDYGYIEISKAGGKEKSHDMVYMGAGGFIGFSGSVGYTWAFMIVIIPVYANVEAGLGVTFFIGSSADPNKTLDSFKNSKEMKGQDFGFYFEIKGNVYVSGTIGVGLYKVIGIRITVSLGFELGYSPNITKWYPEKFDSNFGYVSEVTFTGTIDIFITSIDIYSASWPLPLADGFLYYFQEVRRGNLTISYVENELQDTEASPAEQATARAMIKELSDMIDSDSADTDTIKEKTTALKEYAYDHDMLTWVEKCRIEMNKQGGVVGTIINAALQDDADESGIHFHTNDHVSSKWVANEGKLSAAFSAVESTPLVEDAFAQPSSKILNIGGGKFLMVFLDDTPSRDRQQASTLKWTVYDGNEWSEPVTVQNDSTADGKPNLVDAGDKAVLSWTSIAEEKYQALKAAVRQELSDAGKSSTDTDVQEALEADPTRVLAAMDIFTAEFDKASGTFGAITQLTDDEFYDDNPQAVYDAATKDIIVLYYKTAQDDEDYDTVGDKLLDAVGASADPDKSYSVVAYMLYNSQTDAVDTRGETHEPGWATDYLFPLETSQTLQEQAQFLADYGGQRFLPSTVLYDNGEYADPPIYDLTTAPGYNGLAAFAFTVDKDFDLNTAADRELYMQYYNFETHGTYVPIRVAGDVTYEAEKYNSEIGDFETRQYTEQVEVGAPKLVRNGGSTFLFWREDGKNLKYLNVSDMLNAKVAAVANPTDSESDWKYALNEDGTFETDAVTGVTYAPDAKYVDFGSLTTSSDIEITDYEIITDEYDNLYVVWTDTVKHDVTNEIGETYPVVSQAIYASAMISQDGREIEYEDGETGETVTRTENTVSWSKPYRLTRENDFNDGLALALDDDGNLIIVHNNYSKKTAESEEEVIQLIKDGKLGIAYDKEGNAYAPTLTYNSPVTLTVTKCEKIGSLEATSFEYSDSNPAPGETVKVKATLENVGLTDAEGSEAEFYEYKDGVLGKKIYSYTSSEHIQVNTARTATFRWTVPEDGVEGVQIAAVIKEKRPEGGYYPAVTTYSDPLREEAVLALTINDVQQEGDKFRVDYTVTNAGNAPVAEGTKVGINLTGLHGDLDSERYGFIEDRQVYSTDLVLAGKTAEPNIQYAAIDDTVYERKSSTVHNAVFSESVLVDIPASLFRFCGFDAIQLVIEDAKGNITEESDQTLVKLSAPVNLSLNGGKAIALNGASSEQADVTYDSTVFMEESRVLYSVEDPSVATVSENGVVSGVKNGTTTLTATLLPSGRQTSVDVTVTGIQNDDITGDWGNVTATLTVENGAATVAVSGADEVALEVSVIIASYNEAGKMIAVKSTKGDAATVKSATAEVPDGAVCVKAFVMNEDYKPITANQIWNAQ